MTPTRKQLGDKIRLARQAKGLTLRAAAERLKIDPGYYSKIENGQNPLGKHAAPIARLYGMNREELEAMASTKLPNFGAYLRARYDLSDDAVAELEEHFTAVTKKAPRKSRGTS